MCQLQEGRTYYCQGHGDSKSLCHSHCEAENRNASDILSGVASLADSEADCSVYKTEEKTYTVTEKAEPVKETYKPVQKDDHAKDDGKDSQEKHY